MKQTALALLALCTSFILQAQSFPLCLTPGTYSPAVGTNPRSLACGDLNNDGTTDLAVGNSNSGNISILMGAGSGSFAPAVNYTVGSAPFSVVLADFNGDGNKDIAAADYNMGSVYLLLGSATGTFAAGGSFGAGTNPYWLVTADLNSDGNADLAVTNNSSNNVSVLLGTGTGSFLPAVNYPVGQTPRSIAKGDFNGDGSIDLATANSNSNTVSVLLNQGNGTYASAVSYMAATGPYSLLSADLNNDGNADLAVANDGSSNVSVLLGTGTGSFAPPANYAVGPFPFSITAGDFNNDSQADLAVAIYGNDQVAVLLGSATGTFAAAVTYSMGLYPFAVTTGDFDSNGKQDIAAVNFQSNKVGLLFNGPVITLSTASLICAGASITITAGGAGSYSWSTGATGSSVVVSPTLTASYTVTGAATASCGNSAVKTISVLAIPVVTVNSGVICKGQSFTLTPSGATTYTISGGTAIVSPGLNASYSVTGTSSFGCVSQSLAIATVTVNPLPLLVPAASASFLCIGETATLTASGAASYTWSTGGNGSLTLVSPLATGNYSVSGTDANGCTGNAAITLSVDACLGMLQQAESQEAPVLFPNPNKGSFRIETTGIARATIYNSLGQLIAEQDLAPGKNAVELNSQVKGIYNVMIRQGVVLKTIKIIIQ